MNNNGFYALAFDEGGYGEIQWPLKEGSRFTICVKYLNGCCSENGSLIELNNVFTLDIREGELCLNDMSSGCKLLSECFGTIYIVYDGNDLKLYSENIPVYKTGIKPKSGKADRLLIGRGLRKSYIRSVTIYNEAFSTDRMKEGLFNIVSGYEKHIDFTENKAADMVFNNCHIENMVYALDCRKGTVSSQLTGITEEYTILLSFYALENEMSKGVLFSSGDISISLESDDLPDRFTLCLKYGDKKLYTAGHISAGIWTDIELVQRKNVLELYSNGIKWGAANGTFSISGKKAELGSFKGYIDSLMILNEAVSEEKMKEFTDAQTHMFDGKVICCCEFSDNTETEIRKGIPLIYTNSEITLVKGTNAKTETESVSLPSATGEFDNFDKWEINTLSALILNWLHNVTGVYPDRGVKNIEGAMETTPEFDAFFYDRIAECPEAQKILYDYDDLNDKKLIAFISALTASGAMAMLIYYVYKNAKKCKAIIAFIKAVLFSEEAKDVLFGTLVLVAVAVALKIIGEIPRPPERKKHSDIFIENVSVENTVISIDGTGKDADVRGVIVKNKPSKLKITLSCTGYDRSFTIKTGAGKDSIISTADKKVVFEDKKSAEFTLDIQTEKFDGSYGKYKAELKLSAVSSDSEQKFLGTVSIVLYILENTPCSPWDKSVKVSVLELFGKCYESEKGSSKDFLTDYVSFIEKQPDKGAGSAREYSSLPDYLHNSVIFNTSAFSDAVLRKDKTSPADICGLEHTIIDINWEDITEAAQTLMRHKGSPIHSIEAQIYIAAKKAIADGANKFIFGENADIIYGGMNGLLAKDWLFSEFVDRYTYVMPYKVLKEPEMILDPFKEYEIDGHIDGHDFINKYFRQEALGTYTNACETAGIEFVGPYSQTYFDAKIDYKRIRSGDTKYIIREAFKLLYPNEELPAKIPMPRPLDEWLREWKGPTRAEFWPHCTDNMTGDQKWMVWSLEQYLNILDAE